MADIHVTRKPPSVLPWVIGMGLVHDYAATGIRRLSEALRAVAATVVATNEPVAQRLAKFEEGADVMASIQAARSSGSIALTNRVDGRRRLAESIEVNRPLLDQEQRLTQFFDQPAETLALLAQQPAMLATHSVRK